MVRYFLKQLCILLLALVRDYCSSVCRNLELSLHRANDGNLYTFEEFVAHYGEENGTWKWEHHAQVLLRSSYALMLADGTRLLGDSNEVLAELLENRDSA